MICFTGKSYCSEYSTCATSDCVRNLPTDLRGNSGLPAGLLDFKSDTCGFTPVLSKTLGKRERTVVFSLFMRSLIDNACTANTAVITLREHLRHLEGQYYRKNKVKYTELVKISQKAYRNTLIIHDNTHIAPFFVIYALFLEQKNVFTGNFKVKKEVFDRVFTLYDKKHTENEVENAEKVVKTLIKEAEVALNAL